MVRRLKGPVNKSADQQKPLPMFRCAGLPQPAAAAATLATATATRLAWSRCRRVHWRGGGSGSSSGGGLLLPCLLVLGQLGAPGILHAVGTGGSAGTKRSFGAPSQLSGCRAGTSEPLPGVGGPTSTPRLRTSWAFSCALCSLPPRQGHSGDRATLSGASNTVCPIHTIHPETNNREIGRSIGCCPLTRPASSVG